MAIINLWNGEQNFIPDSINSANNIRFTRTLEHILLNDLSNISLLMSSIKKMNTSGGVSNIFKGIQKDIGGFEYAMKRYIFGLSKLNSNGSLTAYSPYSIEFFDDHIKQYAVHNFPMFREKMNDSLVSLEKRLSILGQKLSGSGMDLTDRSNDVVDAYVRGVSDLNNLRNDMILTNFDSKSVDVMVVASDLLQMKKNYKTANSENDFDYLFEGIKSLKRKANDTYSVSFKNGKIEKNFRITFINGQTRDYLVECETIKGKEKGFKLYFGDEYGVKSEQVYNSKSLMQYNRETIKNLFMSAYSHGLDSPKMSVFKDYVSHAIDTNSLEHGSRVNYSSQFTLPNLSENMTMLGLRSKRGVKTIVRNGCKESLNVVPENHWVIESKVRKQGIYEKGQHLRALYS